MMTAIWNAAWPYLFLWGLLFSVYMMIRAFAPDAPPRAQPRRHGRRS